MIIIEILNFILERDNILNVQNKRTIVIILVSNSWRPYYKKKKCVILYFENKNVRKINLK